MSNYGASLDSDSKSMDAPPGPVNPKQRLDSIGESANGEPEPDRRRRLLVLVPILFLSCLFYFWTGTTGAARTTFGRQTDPYNELTDGFLNGHLDLLQPAPAGLTSLKDPYDPSQNAPWLSQYRDLALYKGRLLFDVGCNPRRDPSHTMAAAPRRWHADQPGYHSLLLSRAPFFRSAPLLSRGSLPTEYEDLATRSGRRGVGVMQCRAVPTPTTICLRARDLERILFRDAGRYLLASGELSSRRRPWRIAVGSFSIGLATGGRPDLVFASLLLVALLVHALRRDPSARPSQDPQIWSPLSWTICCGLCPRAGI